MPARPRCKSSESEHNNHEVAYGTLPIQDPTSCLLIHRGYHHQTARQQSASTAFQFQRQGALPPLSPPRRGRGGRPAPHHPAAASGGTHLCPPPVASVCPLSGSPLRPRQHYRHPITTGTPPTAPSPTVGRLCHSRHSRHSAAAAAEGRRWAGLRRSACAPVGSQSETCAVFERFALME